MIARVAVRMRASRIRLSMVLSLILYWYRSVKGEGSSLSVAI